MLLIFEKKQFWGTKSENLFSAIFLITSTFIKIKIWNNSLHFAMYCHLQNNFILSSFQIAVVFLWHPFSAWTRTGKNYIYRTRDPRRSFPALLSRPFCPGPSVPDVLSRLSVGALPFCPGKCRFVPSIKRGRERPPGKAAEEVELETDDEGNNLMPLQPKSPLQLQRDGLLHVVCSKYNLIFIYYQLVCLEKVWTVVRLLQVELEITRHSQICRSPCRKIRNRWGKDFANRLDLLN